MTWTRALSPGPLSRRDTGLVAVATIVQVLGVRTGPPAPSPEPLLGLAALLLALAQGLSLLWRRAHAAAVLVASTLGFVAYALRAVAPGRWRADGRVRRGAVSRCHSRARRARPGLTPSHITSGV